MQKVKIETSQNVFIEYPAASLAERLLARGIDFCIRLGIALILLRIIDGLPYELYDRFEGPFRIFVIMLYVFYHFYMEAIFNGQSPGKKIMKIKVMNMDGGRPSVGGYFTRSLIGFFEVDVTFGGFALVWLMFNKNGQRLGDVSAGTAVVNLRKEKLHNNASDFKFDVNYEVVYPQAKYLTDKQVSLINEVLYQKYSFTKHKGAKKLSDKIKESMNIVTDEKPTKFLARLVKDYAFFYWEEENRGQFEALKKDISEYDYLFPA